MQTCRSRQHAARVFLLYDPVILFRLERVAYLLVEEFLLSSRYLLEEGCQQYVLHCLCHFRLVAVCLAVSLKAQRQICVQPSGDATPLLSQVTQAHPVTGPLLLAMI